LTAIERSSFGEERKVERISKDPQREEKRGCIDQATG